eukprot:10051398-Heterocapsa_arctica.AAC.1
MSDDNFRELDKARIESIKMLQIFWYVVNRAQAEDVTRQYTHFALEWPRWSSGWSLNIVRKLFG